MSTYRIGEADEHGYILRNENDEQTVELCETPNGNYVVYLYAPDEHFLYAFRKRREDADAIFYSFCNMLASLPPEGR